ncbi:hypothetical protein KUCAC02_025407, partial [Chaenocephalus aceratus]
GSGEEGRGLITTVMGGPGNSLCCGGPRFESRLLPLLLIQSVYKLSPNQTERGSVCCALNTSGHTDRELQ